MINTVFPGGGPASVRGIAAKAGLPPPIDLFSLFEKHCPVTGGTPGHAANDTDVNCDWVGSGGTDGCHPNDIGYGQVAALVAAAITQQPPEPLRGVPLLTGAKRLRTDDDGGSEAASWPCPKDFPYPDTQPNTFACYNDKAYAKRREGPCGSWCVDCKGFGHGCGTEPICSTASGYSGCPPPPPPPAPPIPFPLVKLPEYVESHGARCLDGSPASFYLQGQEQNMSSTDFIVDFEGGGVRATTFYFVYTCSRLAANSKTFPVVLRRRCRPKQPAGRAVQLRLPRECLASWH